MLRRHLGIPAVVALMAIPMACASSGSSGRTPDGGDHPKDAAVGDGNVKPDGALKPDAGCGALLTLCDGECVDLLTNPAHCGSCDHACDTNTQVCVAAECQKDCGSQVLCDGICVDTKTDSDNCGSCGNQCPNGTNCSDSECVMHLGGTLSGRIDYRGVTVLVDSDVTVTPYNGSDDVTNCNPGETGCLSIVAQKIVVANGVTIRAKGSGYGGGGGGGGGGGNIGPGTNCSSSDTCSHCTLGSGGAGHAGGHNGAAAPQGTNGQSVSGAGGKGGGPFGGAGGTRAVSNSTDGAKNGHNGASGGYAGTTTNDDTSTDESLKMGSGGGGGSGGASAYEHDYSSVGGSGGGGAGNPGGGYVKLVATVEVDIQGTINTSGRKTSTGNGASGTDGRYGGYTCDLGGSGGNGGSAAASGASAGGIGVAGFFQAVYNDCINRNCGDSDQPWSVNGGAGGAGGAGAGGGVLIKAPSITISGNINARGGSSATNGGTVKIFYKGTAPSTSGITAGRTYVTTY